MRSWSMALVAVLAVGCTQLLGFDDEYGPEPDAGAAGAGTLNSTGSGGAETGGMAQGGSGMGGSPSSSSAGTGGGGMIYSWDAQTGMNSDGTFTLPSWLRFESPSSGKTSQTGASTLRIGFGPDAPRARNVTGMQADWGLSVESERKNVVHYSDSWSDMSGYWQNLPPPNGMTAVPMQTDPAGGMTATLFQSTGNQASAYVTLDAQVLSGWFRGQGSPGDPGPVGGPLSYAHFRHVDAATADYTDVTTDAWIRYSLTNPMKANGTIVLETRDRPIGSGAGAITTPTDIFAYGAQVEPTGAYPSSYIPTTNADVARVAEKLWSPMASALVQGGFFHINLRFAPNYATGEQAGDHDLIVFKDNNNRLFVRWMDNAIVLRVDGQEIALDPLTWAREQPLTVVAVNAASELSLSVTGATSGNGTKVLPMGMPVQLAADLYILSNPLGAQECADLRYISFAMP